MIFPILLYSIWELCTNYWLRVFLPVSSTFFHFFPVSSGRNWKKYLFSSFFHSSRKKPISSESFRTLVEGSPIPPFRPMVPLPNVLTHCPFILPGGVLRATIFFGIGPHKFPKVPRQYFCDPPPIWWSKILWPHSPGATMLKKYVTPNARSAENMHFGAISLNKIFIKIYSHPIISWFFVTPLFLMKKFCDPPAFSWPPIRKKMIAPLVGLQHCMSKVYPGTCRWNGSQNQLNSWYNDDP